MYAVILSIFCIAIDTPGPDSPHCFLGNNATKTAPVGEMIVSINYNSSGPNCDEFGGCCLIDDTEDMELPVSGDTKIANIALNFTIEGIYIVNCSLASQIVTSTIQIQVTRK